MKISRRVLRKKLLNILKESVAISPEVFISTFQPKTLKFKKSNLTYKKAAIYSSSPNDINMSAYFPAISSAMLAKFKTANDFGNFLDYSLKLGQGKLFLVPEQVNPDDEKIGTVKGGLPITPDSVDIWEFDPEDETSSYARQYMAAAFLGTEAGAVGTIGEALAAAISIPNYGADKWGITGQITDCNTSPWHSNFPSVDLYVGSGDGTVAFKTPTAADCPGGIYKIPGLFLSAKLSQKETCYVELKYPPLARLFMTLLQGNPGIPNSTEFEDFNSILNGLLPPECQEVHLDYGFANGGVSSTTTSPEYKDTNKGFKAGIPDPTTIQNVASLEERMMIGIKISAKSLFHNLVSISKNPSSPSWGEEHAIDSSGVQISGNAQKGFTKANTPTALQSSHAAIIGKSPEDRMYHIKELKEKFDQIDLPDIREFIKNVLSSGNTMASAATAGETTFTDIQINAVIFKSLEFTLREIAGLSSTTQKSIPSTQTAGIANLYLSDKCVIKLKRKTGDDSDKFEIILPAESFQLESIPDIKIGSPEAAKEKLGIDFEAVCGVAFAGNLQTLVSDMHKFTDDQESFIKTFLKYSKPQLFKAISPFQKIRLPAGEDTPQKIVPGEVKKKDLLDSNENFLSDKDFGKQTLLSASLIIKEIVSLFTDVINDFPPGSSMHKNVAIAFKKIYVDANVDFTQATNTMTSSVMSRISAPAQAAAIPGQTLDQKFARAAYDASVMFIVVNTLALYRNDPVQDNIEKIRGGILAATGIVGSTDFSDEIQENLNAQVPGPPPLGDLLFSARGVLPESFLFENAELDYNILLEICKLYLAGVAFAAHLGVELIPIQKVREYTSEFINSTQFKKEIIDTDNVVQLSAYNQEERTSQALNTQQSNISKGSVQIKRVAESKIYENILKILLEYTK